MKGLKNGIKFLALFMCVIMVFATGVFVTSHSFKAGDADDSDVYYTQDDISQDFAYIYDDDVDYGIDSIYDDYDEDDYDDDDYYDDEDDDDYDDEDDEDIDDEDDDEDEDSDTDEDDEDDSDEVSYPAGVLEASSASGILVRADFGEGVFPEGVELRVSDVSSDKALSTVRKVIDDASEAAAVDISFYDEDGSELHSTESGRVSLSVSLASALSAPVLKLVHVEDSGAAYEINGQISKNGASFTANSFSVFAIAGSGAANDTAQAATTETASSETAENQEAAQETQEAAAEVPSGVSITISAASATKAYDKVPVAKKDLIRSVIVNGTAASDISVEDSAISFTWQGNRYTASQVSVETLLNGTPADLINVGHYDISVKGADAAAITAGGQSVTGSVTVENGTYDITRREIILTSGSGEWFYDGREHKAELVATTGDGWLEGDAPEYVFTGSQKYVGSSDNYFVLKSDAAKKTTNWADAFPNYNVVVCYGRLSVVPNPVK